MFDISPMMTLPEYVAANGPKTDEEWSKLFGVSRSHFNMLRNGTARPSVYLAQHMEQVTEGAVSRHHTRPDVYGPPAGEKAGAA